MPKLDNYETVQVHQHSSTTGHLPAALEWMVRFKGIDGVDLEIFQEEFDLERRGMGQNGFQTVPVYVQRKYPQVQTMSVGFATAEEKVERIAECLENGEPCLISILSELGTIFAPVVELEDDVVKVLALDGEQQATQELTLDRIRDMHSASIQGRDLLVWGSEGPTQTIRLTLD